MNQAAKMPPVSLFTVIQYVTVTIYNIIKKCCKQYKLRLYSFHKASSLDPLV